MAARILSIVGVAMLFWSSTNQSLARDENAVPLIPSIGIPYASTTGSGALFMGTIDLDVFASTGEGLIATGILRFRRRAVPLEFPVEVLRADCFMLELAVGPPAFRGLQEPLVIVETPGRSELRQADFCRNGIAYAEGDFDELAMLLNEEELLDAGLLGACPWYKAVGCSAALTICAVPCSSNANNCIACVKAISETCVDCI